MKTLARMLWKWLKVPLPVDIVPLKVALLFVPLCTIAAFWYVDSRNWKQAHDSLLHYTQMTPQVLIKDHGWLTPDPKAKFHIIIGYQIDNCVIELPPDGSVVADNDIYVDSPYIKHVFELAKGRP